MQATDDREFWNSTLASALHAIMSAYHDGTQFDIHADQDGLISGGSTDTQLTWMDAKLGDQAVTPRHGKCVEVNALWHSLLRTLARRSADKDLAETCGRRAGLVAESFRAAFWNAEMKCLHDVITDGTPDGSIRPNQIIAVSVPHSPLTAPQQRTVVDAVARHLLTPLGLRTLCREDPRYRGRYGSSWESRDRAYHQGTVWAWLIGPFIEAYLKVRAGDSGALRQADGWLEAFDAHLDRAGVGHVSEIFDGDPPHEPRGCIAQAWSVAEVLRAKRLVARARQEAEG
jgi:predicted glycogen debranching enzyme